MAASDVVLQRLMKDGWQPMNASQGCDFIGHLLTVKDLSQVAVLPVDWGLFVARIPGAANWSTLEHLVPTSQSSSLTANSADAAAERVKAAAPGERVDLIVSYLLERIAQTLRVPAADLDQFADLTALGVDSLIAVELRIWVQGDLDVELAVEQLFTTPSIRDLAGVIEQQLRGEDLASQTPERAAIDKERSRWIVCPQPRPEAQVQLFCFSYAGGGASAFKEWADELPVTIELNIVQLPGREDRLSEPLITDMATLVKAIAPEILAQANRPFAFFGHSMGAIVSHEVARRLAETEAKQPQHLYLSARAAPQLQERSEPLRFLGNEELMDRLHQTYGAVPEAIRKSAELQQVFLPILRADVELLETHTDASIVPLNYPITVFGGDSDPAISGAMLAGWKEQSSADFAQHEFPGDHFFIHTAREAVIATIAASLNNALSTRKHKSND